MYKIATVDCAFAERAFLNLTIDHFKKLIFIFFIFTALLFSTSHAQTVLDSQSTLLVNPQKVELRVGGHGTGEWVTLWGRMGTNSSYYALWAQKTNGKGEAQWTTSGVVTPVKVFSNSTITSTYQRRGRNIIPDENGGVFIVWQHLKKSSIYVTIYAQHLDGNGTQLWGDGGIILQQTSNGCNWDFSPPAMVADGNGGFIAAWEWEYGECYTALNLSVQRVNTDGTTAWSSIVTLPYTENEDCIAPMATTDGSGGAYITYESNPSSDGINFYAKVQHITGDGETLSSGQILGTGSQDRGIAKGPNGSAYTIWTDPNNTLRMNRVRSDATLTMGASGDSLFAQPTNPGFIRTTDDGAGNVIVAVNQDQSTFIAQKYDSTGTALWGSGVPLSSAGQVSPFLTKDGSGGAFFAWVVDSVSSAYGTAQVYGQRIRADGSKSWLPTGSDTTKNKGVWVASNAVGPAYHLFNAIASDSTPCAVISWADSISSGSHIYEQRINQNGVLGFLWHKIIATAGSHGSISPADTITVEEGASQQFTVTPSYNYHVDSVIVDGVNKGAVKTYTFSNITSDHTIRATFAIDRDTIIAQAGSHGSISPSGTVVVDSGGSQTFTFTSNTGYHVDSLFIDGGYDTSKTSYTFTNIVSNHTITVKFAINQYYITASAGSHGSISPSGSVIVDYGSDTTFVITPDSSYYIDSVIVNGTYRGMILKYTFDNVRGDSSIRVTFSEEANCVVTHLKGWNMLSLPMTVMDFSKSAVFPTSTGSAFTYEQIYRRKDTISVGAGYWVKFTAAETVRVGGLPVASETTSVRQGWNMIGSISTPVALDSITSDPPGMIASRAFGYSGRYTQVDTIVPGRGYWIKVSEGGKLILSSSTTGFAKASGACIRIMSIDETPPPAPDESESVMREVPKDFALEEAYPNPFNPVTDINYSLPVDSRVRIRVYNVLGQMIATLVDGAQPAGYWSVQWDASAKASGLYIYRLDATSTSNPDNSFREIRKMLLVR